MTTFTGMGSMAGLILRRDRIRLPVWVGAILGLVYASGGAVQGIYGTPEAAASYQASVGTSAAAIAMSGPPVALDTVAGITVFEINATAIIATALMAIFLTVRHTRDEEEAGRTELLRAGILGRDAPPAAAVTVVSAASLAVGAGISLLMLGLGLPTAGSMVYGASIAAVGLVFTGIGAVAAQVTTHGRAARGLASVILGAAFIIRAVGDVGTSWVSWLSPIGWSQAVHAFADNRWWPLLLSAGFFVGLMFIARSLLARRDLGEGLVAERAGPPHASPRLSGPIGLAARLQRGSIIGWAVGLFLTGAAIGSFVNEVEALAEDNPTLVDFLRQTGGGDLVGAFLTSMILILALMAGGFTISSVLRMRAEEEAGHAESLLGTGLSRWGWTSGSLMVTLVGSVLVMAAGGVGLGLGLALASGDTGQILLLTGAALTYLPAVLILGAVAVLLFGWFRRAATVAWVALAAVFVIGYLGDLLELPQWLVESSPFSHTPALPNDPFAIGPVAILAAIAVAATVAGLVGFRRRDVG